MEAKKKDAEKKSGRLYSWSATIGAQLTLCSANGKRSLGELGGRWWTVVVIPEKPAVWRLHTRATQTDLAEVGGRSVTLLAHTLSQSSQCGCGCGVNRPVPGHDLAVSFAFGSQSPIPLCPVLSKAQLKPACCFEAGSVKF
jgi:hypothetical protein